MIASLALVALCSVVVPPAVAAAPSATTVYVATTGNDAWSGKLPKPNAGKTDGPLATLAGAREALRRLKAAGGLQGPVQVEVLAWATLKDLLSNDCGKMTNDLGAPDYVCFSGLWKDSSAPKEVYETLMTDIVPE